MWRLDAWCGGGPELRVNSHPDIPLSDGASAIERLREHPRVLCIQDTSEPDYAGKTDIQELRPLNYGNRQGLGVHDSSGDPLVPLPIPCDHAVSFFDPSL